MVTFSQEELEKLSRLFFVKVYFWISVALIITGVTARYVASNEELTRLIAKNDFLGFVLFAAEMALVFVISGGVPRLSYNKVWMLFIVYSILNGISLSAIFLVFTEESIAVTFFITATTFIFSALWGYLTKTNLTRFGNLLFTALIGLILASIINRQIGTDKSSFLISIAGIFIFIGLTGYHTQKLKDYHQEQSQKAIDPDRVAVVGALLLYLDFINLFLEILELFGIKKSSPKSFTKGSF